MDWETVYDGDAEGVGAAGVKQAVAEGDQVGSQEQDHAQDDQALGEGDRQQEKEPAGQKWRDQHQQGEADQDGLRAASEPHILRTSMPPNNPLGLISRISVMRA